MKISKALTPRLGIAAVLLALAGTTPSALAQEFDRVLIPLFVESAEGVPGANGSRWRTFFELYNQSDQEVLVVSTPSFDCHIGGCEFSAAPHSFFRPSISPSPSNGADFIYIERTDEPAITANLRVQDLSRQQQTWGTEIPLVWDHEYLDGRFQLLNIPTTAAFRQTLRIYDDEGRNGSLVRVKIFAHDTGALLGESVLTLSGSFGSPDPSSPAATAVLAFDEEWPAILSADRVRIEIEPVDPGVRLWAFVSVTNNDTQHVTMVTPQ